LTAQDLFETRIEKLWSIPLTKPAGRPPRSEEDVTKFRTKVSKGAMALYREQGFEAVSMRRLSKTIGCAPTTLYAHFSGKTEILMLLWSDILTEMAAHIELCLRPISHPVDKLQTAAVIFVTYWIDHPDHFRLVFMSNDVGRSDVDGFLQNTDALQHFRVFDDLISDLDQTNSPLRVQADTLIAGLIGLAMCLNTLHGYKWSVMSEMVNQLLTGFINDPEQQH
jgi:AcrR family transcriptional regulator